MQNIKNFVKDHSELFTILGLFLVFYFLFFHNLGNYALMDVDETRYAIMSRYMFNTKDFMTLYVNGEYFFEKPPLFFWFECLSFKLFGAINEFTVRFPIALYGMLSCFLVYFTGKKVFSREYGVISALILGTSFEFAILSKYAILDILLSTCIGFSVYFGLMTFFCKEQNKKYFWWLFYIFSGLAVMAKGVPGFIIPFGTMFFASIISKRYDGFKEIFKPQYFIVGVILFLLIVLPWHIAMFKLHDPLFFNEYIMKHHLSRFVDSKGLGRVEPWYYFILVFLWGFIPWVISAVSVLIAKISKLKLGELKFKEFSFENLSNIKKFLVFNGIAFVLIFALFSSSSTKLMTYLLPVYFPAAFLMGWVWYEYIKSEKYKKAVDLSVYIFNGILVLAAFLAIFIKFYLPPQLYNDILPLQWFCVLTVGLPALIGIIFAKKNNRIGVFAMYITFIAVLSGFGTKKMFELDYKFGQDDLIKYAKVAKEENKSLNTVGFQHKYSLIFYGAKDVEFEPKLNCKLLNSALNKENGYAIIRNKDIKKIEDCTKFNVIETGRKFTLLSK